MATTLTQARNILTAPELDLFAHSRTEGLKALTPARLRAKLVRARALRDKYQDLYRRQSLASRERTASKRGASGEANERTQAKAAVFAEVIDRFEQRIAYCEAVEAREQARREASATRKAAAPAGRKAAGPSTRARQAASKSGARSKARSASKGMAADATTARGARARSRTQH
ncbi:MAG: hypothetical protein J0H69_11805 [Burkholderiales bacterium]|nr:hypothetical protein [Burkholderiales bacterium]